MIEIRCTSCLTRYRIDESVVPAGRPTFKCSRCGHVFSIEPSASRRGAQAADGLKRQPELLARPKPLGPRPQLVAKPPQAAASTPLHPPVPSAPQQEAEHNPLARSFADHDDFKPGENLSFDFADTLAHRDQPAAPSSEAAGEGKWQVGAADTDFQAESERLGPSEIAESQSPPHAIAPARFEQPAAIPDDADRESWPEPPVDNGAIHSSGFFLLGFLLLLFAFAALSVRISNQPGPTRDLLSGIPPLAGYFAPSRPLITLREIHANYGRLKDNRPALLISGRADNLGQRPLNALQVEVDLLDPARRGLARQAVYCGNLISPRMIAELTPRELQFFQRLAPPRNFIVNSGQSSSFLAVFIDPPAGSAGFRVGVSRTQTPDDATPPHA
jgi:predicted Zn finger-like uncharacterized protein